MTALLLLIACTIRPTPPGPSPAELRAQPVELLRLHAEAQDTFFAGAMIRAGAAYDPIGQEGVAFLAAQSLAREPELQVDGATLAVWVGREFVGVAVKGETPEAALALLAEALRPREPSPEALAAAAADARAELATIEANPAWLARELLRAHVFAAHPYGHPIAGRRGVAELLDAEAVARFRATTWVRESVRVGLYGAAPEEALQELQAALDALTASRAPRPLPATNPRLEGLDLLVVESDAPLDALAVGLPLDVRPGRPDVARMAAATSDFELGKAYLSLDPSNTQPTLELSMPAMPSAELPDALTASLQALDDWRAAAPSSSSVRPPPLPDALVWDALRSWAQPPGELDPWAALPEPGSAFIVVVTSEPDRFFEGQGEESEAPDVHATDEARHPASPYARATLLSHEDLLR